MKIIRSILITVACAEQCDSEDIKNDKVAKFSHLLKLYTISVTMTSVKINLIKESVMLYKSRLWMLKAAKWFAKMLTLVI